MAFSCKQLVLIGFVVALTLTYLAEDILPIQHQVQLRSENSAE